MQDWRQAALLAAAAAATSAAFGAAVAQDSLQGVVVTGAAGGATPRNGGAATVTLAPGRRVESPPGRCTEIVFSDGTSVVLEPGADFTRQAVERDPDTGRLVLRASAGRGRLRITTSDRVDVLLATPGVETRVVAASAVVQAGAGGSATLVSGGRVVVRGPGGREEVIRRPGFGTSFDRGGVQRQTPEEMAEAVAAFAPVERRQAVCREAAGRRPAPAEPVVQVAQRQPAARPVAEERAFRQRNEGAAVPGLGGRGGADAFALAAGGLGGPGSEGGAIGAPRANSTTSVLNSANEIGSVGGQEAGLNVVGLAAIQPQGTARIRRFATGAGGGVPGGRVDTGIVAPPATALAPGQPARGPTTTYFRDLLRDPLPVGQAQTFYDAVGRSGVVTLQVDNVLNPAERSQGGDFDRVYVPRFYVTDANAPSLTRTEGFTVRPFNRQTGQYDTPLSAPSGLSLFTTPERNALSAQGGATIFVVDRDAPLDDRQFTISRLNSATGVAEKQSNPLDPSGQNRFSPAERDEFLGGAGPQASGPVYSAELFRVGGQPQTDNLLVHRSGAVFEIELRQRPTNFSVADRQGGASATLPPPRTEAAGRRGTVFALPGESGLAVQAGGAPLPGVTYAVRDTLAFPAGPQEAGEGGRLTTPSGTRDRFTDIRPEQTPEVFIIDKITAGSEAIFAERGIQSGERYFVIGGRALAPPEGGGLPGAPPDTVTRFAVSDGLNPAPGNFVAGQTIQDQFRGPGRSDQPAAFNFFNAFRPEETFVGYVAPGVARGDTHLLVVAGAGDRNPAMRADLEVAADGRTSASVAAGGIARLPAGDRSLALSGAVVGATRVAGTERGATAIASNLGSLGTDASGYGAHLFGGNDRAPGQIGYFAVGEADTRNGGPGQPGGIQPGTLQDLGAGATITGEYSFTRLATNVGPFADATSRVPLALQGFASGIVETRSGGGAGEVYGASTAELGGVAVAGRGGREFDAAIRLSPTAAGDLPVNPLARRAPAAVAGGDRVLAFGNGGGAVPTTAVASATTFAGVVPGRAAMASVDADLRRGIAGHETPGRGALPPSNEHLAWGFFLGDLVNEANGTRREHASLGFWVAGRPVDPGTLSTLTGTASYAGGMIGNVAEAGRVRTATGDFTQSWDFGARRGSMAANFDGRGYGVNAAMPAGANVFTGSGVSGDRRMVVQGSFFNAGPLAGAPAAVGGAFGIAGGAYGANGVFVGTRR